MKIYNTLSGQKEEFQPQGDAVKMYVCGVTPYDECHIGHAMSYVLFDVIRRYLEFRGYQVKHVQNFTDIDDKIILRAQNQGIPPQELAERYIQRYFEDMDALNVRRAHIYPRATQEIEEIQRLVSVLVQKGHAYVSGGDVYFRVRSFPTYGQLSKRTLEGMMAGSRVEVEVEKEHPMDFALWKKSRPGEPAWPSPWGPGRPGWHIECSAMSMKYLGATLDIHGGGQDLLFPHHENERAQSEAFAGAGPFARFWIHNGLLRLGQEKMSKSLGNLITVREVLEHHSADALRLFVLGSHYRSPLSYTSEALEAAERAAERLRQVARSGKGGAGAPLEASPYRERFLQAMDDDFNTAQALAVLFDLSRDINRAAEEGGNVVLARQTFLELAREVLGLTLEEPEMPPLNVAPIIELQKSTIARLRRDKLDWVIEQVGTLLNQDGVDVNDVRPYINLLREVRNALRKDKHFELADEIRTKLSELGVALEDTPQGTVGRTGPGHRPKAAPPK
ncbi:MAG: cysteine--tRNA ligase [Chloroflexi bacterium]|nr:cysteine--tRNA ligase [Chloroflexota bacterium]